MMRKKSLFKRSLKDFFTPYFLSLSLLPLLITLAILFASLFYGMQVLNDKMNSLHIEKTTTQYSSATQSHTQSSINVTFDDNKTATSFFDVDPMALIESIQSSEILASLLQNDIARWVIEKLVFLVATYFILIFAVIIAVTIVGFFTPLVVKKLKSRHYPPFLIKGHGSLAYVIWHALKSFFVMILLYVLLIPFYFIPLLNIIAFHLPAFYFFHKMLVFDVGSTINTKEEFLRIKAIVGNQIRLRTFFMYLLTLIPFAGVFFPLLFVIYLSHIFINETIELRMVTGE